MFKELFVEAKKSGMTLPEDVEEALRLISTTAKITGKIYGWKLRKGASMPGYSTINDTVPTEKSRKDIFRASSSKNHTFFVVRRNGDAIAVHPDTGVWWLIEEDVVSGMESVFKRNFIKDIDV